jgi:uncharacterized protein (DUF58 family)
MTRLDGALIERCEGLAAVARRAWGASLLGRRTDCGPVLAATQASGQTDYATGDDFRHVDWNRAARLDELVSRQFRGVETGTVELLIDGSRSMSVGTPTKFELAQQLAAAIGYFVLRSGRQVRIDGQPGITGRQNARTLLGMLSALSIGGKPSDLREAATRTARRLRRGDVAVVLTDLLDADGLDMLIAPFPRPGQQLILVQILAAEDLEPRAAGRVQLRDVESNDVLLSELFDEDLANYRQVAADFCRGVRRHCEARNISLVQLRTDSGFDRCLEHFLHVTSTM